MKALQSWGLALAGVLLMSRSAQAGGVDTYNAPVSGSDLLQVTRAHAETGHGTAFGRLTLAYNKDPVVLRNSDGTERSVIHHQLGAYGAVGLALWHRFQLAALVPFYYQKGERDASQPSIDGTALGDVAVDARVAVLGREDAVEFALAGRASFPTGKDDRYVGDGRVGGYLSAIVSRQFGENGFLITSSITANVRDRSTPGVDTRSTGLLFGLGAGVPLVDTLMLTAEGEIGTEVDHFLGEKASPASLLGGLRWGFGSWLAHIGAGPGLSRGLGTPDYRVLAMIGTNSVPATEPQAAPVRRDTDGDGIDDAYDACVTEPEDKDGFRDDDGCPDLDNDGDGIPDTLDKCPDQAEDKDGFQDEDGCPDLDNDGDGILDVNDKCPNEAETVNGFEDEDGCPEKDTDGDGVFDSVDLCPTEKETVNGVDDEDGCPDLLRVEEAQIRTLEPIYFDTGSDRIQDRSLPLLRELAEVIANRPDLGTISIEGHTDDAGSEHYNQVLSQKRAAAIKRFLSANGVPDTRLIAVGYGEMRPIASNETPEGREQNRRVEFRLADVMSSHE